MIAAQGVAPDKVSRVIRYHMEGMVIAAVFMGVLALCTAFGIKLFPGPPPLTMYERVGLPLVIAIVFTASVVRTIRERKPIRLAMRRAGIRICIRCGKNMAGDENWCCSSCGWTDHLRAAQPMQPGHESQVDPARGAPPVRVRTRSGPITSWMNPELVQAQARMMSMHSLSWWVRYRAELAIGIVLIYLSTAVWWCVRVLALKASLGPAPTGTPTLFLFMSLSPLLFLLVPVTLILVGLKLHRKAINETLRTAGVRICMECGYDMLENDRYRCPECGWIDRLRAPRDEKPSEST